MSEAQGVAIELDAWPNRLDLDWRHLRRARKLGVLVSVKPDAHSVSELDHLRYGIAIARKGCSRPRRCSTRDRSTTCCARDR